ncbi:hypothetical protein BU15DRAFT_69589 [Melanogaster broomeanus]|nr:hypothetical protein BU15DRAFT_69589 [Melanogaster broomeanus]
MVIHGTSRIMVVMASLVHIRCIRRFRLGWYGPNVTVYGAGAGSRVRACLTDSCGSRLESSVMVWWVHGLGRRLVRLLVGNWGGPASSAQVFKTRGQHCSLHRPHCLVHDLVRCCLRRSGPLSLPRASRLALPSCSYFAAGLIVHVCARLGATGLVRLHSIITRSFGMVDGGSGGAHDHAHFFTRTPFPSISMLGVFACTCTTITLAFGGAVLAYILPPSSLTAGSSRASGGPPARPRARGHYCSRHHSTPP